MERKWKLHLGFRVVKFRVYGFVAKKPSRKEVAVGACFVSLGRFACY